MAGITRGDNGPLVSVKHQQRYIHASTSENTRSTYRTAVRHFEQWGGRLPTHSGVLLRYLTENAHTLNPRTLTVYLTAISQWHLYQGLVDPTQAPDVRKTLEGIHRIHGKPKQQAKALTLEHLVAMLHYLDQQPPTPKIVRDRALLLIGFFGAFRRSELVAITAQAIAWEPDGVLITLARSKTDQQGNGVVRAIPRGTTQICPAVALRHWLTMAAIQSGPVFRGINRWQTIQQKALSPSSVTAILKTLGKACGFNFTPELSSHSLRRGLATSAASEKLPFEWIKKQGGWQHDGTVWGYIEESQRLSDNVGLPLMQKMAACLSHKPSALSE